MPSKKIDETAKQVEGLEQKVDEITDKAIHLAEEVAKTKAAKKKNEEGQQPSEKPIMPMRKYKDGDYIAFLRTRIQQLILSDNKEDWQLAGEYFVELLAGTQGGQEK